MNIEIYAERQERQKHKQTIFVDGKKLSQKFSCPHFYEIIAMNWSTRSLQTHSIRLTATPPLTVSTYARARTHRKMLRMECILHNCVKNNLD